MSVMHSKCVLPSNYGHSTCFMGTSSIKKHDPDTVVLDYGVPDHSVSLGFGQIEIEIGV